MSLSDFTGRGGGGAEMGRDILELVGLVKLAPAFLTPERCGNRR